MLIDVHVTVESRGRSKFTLDRSVDHNDEGAAAEVLESIAAAVKHLQRQPKETRPTPGGDDR